MKVTREVVISRALTVIRQSGATPTALLRFASGRTIHNFEISEVIDGGMVGKAEGNTMLVLFNTLETVEFE